MQCPHCLKYFERKPRLESIGQDIKPDADYKVTGGNDNSVTHLQGFMMSTVNCTACGRFVMDLISGRCYDTVSQSGWEFFTKQKRVEMIVPRQRNRTPFEATIPVEFRKDFDEAVAVLPYSANASAALSRRCLQNIIRNKASIKKRNLSEEIEELLKTEHLPSYIDSYLHPIRKLGAIAAHPINSNVTGQIMDVEPKEAQICLLAIKGLFDHYFVHPAVHAKRLQTLETKTQQK